MSAPVKKVPIHLQSSQNRLLIKHGKVVNAHEIIDTDVYIEDGIIKELGKNLIIPGGTRILDVRGMYILPGGIDPHTHFAFEKSGMKSADDFYQGTKAAIAGGTTMIMDFVFPESGESLVEAFYLRRNAADGQVCCDYSLHACVTWWSEEVKKEMEELCNKHGINSFKMFMAYKNEYMLNDCNLYSAFDTCKELGAIPMVHAENGDIIDQNVKKLLSEGVTGPEGHAISRPEIIEAEAVNRACVIANQVKGPVYIDGLTSKRAADILAPYREENKVIGAVMASSLGIDIISSSFSTVTDPPLRSHSSLHLIQLLADGYLQVTGSDDCTYTSEQKSVGKSDFTQIPAGVNGVEDRMSVIWEKGVESGAMDPQQFVAITSANAAKIFNIYPQKGCIAVGSDADIVVWNHRKTRTISAKTHHQATDVNIFEGMVVHGVPEFVIVNGRVCFEEGEVKPVQGFGKFIPTLPFPPFIYGSDSDLLMFSNGESKVDGLKEDKAEGSEKSFSSATEKSDYDMFPDRAAHATGKGARHEGQRNLQESTFSISCELDDTSRRSCIRVYNPPGGKSSGSFW
ncbi:dihydropyrimidinase isoform X2 [Halyomorpha halys]|nr:dihydropyrimidinase isoform X2 [Halyomorpha halys]